MAQGEEKAIQVSSVADVGADTNYVVSKVGFSVRLYCPISSCCDICVLLCV